MKKVSAWLFLALLLAQVSSPSFARELADDLLVQTRTLRLQFSEQGDLLRTEACFPSCDSNQINSRVLSSQAGMLVFSGAGKADLTRSKQHSGSWDLRRSREENSTVLEFSTANGQAARRWQIPDAGWLISLTVRGESSAQMASGQGFRPQPSSGFGNWLEQSRYLFFDGSDVSIMGLDDDEAVNLTSAGWFGFRNRFWAVMMLSDTGLPLSAKTEDGLEDANISMQFDGSQPQKLSLYLGPVEPSALAQAAAKLEDLMYSGLWFWLRWICQALYYLLGAIEKVIPSWGLSVMVLSVLVGLLMRPLSRVAERLQDQVHAIDARLAPALADIKKNNKGAVQSEKILALYKSEAVHPLYSLKSMLGVFLVIPVFIGAFDMLAENIHLSGESFLWMADLSHPDAFMALPFNLPFFGGYLNLLPFIMTGFSFIASKLHRHPDMSVLQQRKQSRNLLLMSFGFLVLFYTFPAGMVLYWTTNNLISVIRMAWSRRQQGAA